MNHVRGSELNKPPPGLDASPESGYLVGVSLFGVLQMLHLERKSCRIEATAGTTEGWIHLRNGEIVDAAVHELRGELAVFHLLALPGPRIVLRAAPTEGQDTIETPLSHLLMEAIRRQDETDPKPISDDAAPRPAGTNGLPRFHGRDEIGGIEGFADLDALLAGSPGDAGPALPSTEPIARRSVSHAAHPDAPRYEPLLRWLLDIEGVLAAALVNHASDEIIALAAVSTSDARAVRLAIPAFAEIVRLEVSASGAPDEARPVEEMLFSHDRQHNLVWVLGPEQRCFLYVAVSRPTGNLALTRRMLETVAAALVAEQPV